MGLSRVRREKSKARNLNSTCVNSTSDQLIIFSTDENTAKIAQLLEEYQGGRGFGITLEMLYRCKHEDKRSPVTTTVWIQPYSNLSAVFDCDLPMNGFWQLQGFVYRDPVVSNVGIEEWTVGSCWIMLEHHQHDVANNSSRDPMAQMSVCCHCYRL